MLAKLAWVNGHLAELTGPERFVLEAILETPSRLPVTRVIPRGNSGLSFGLGRPEFEIDGALSGLGRAELLYWDSSRGIALMPELWRSQKHWCQSPNHLRGWYRGWLELSRESVLTYAALVAVRKLVPLATETQAFARVWSETFARPLAEYLRWGGLDDESARRFSGLLSQAEIQALPGAAATGARRQADFRARRSGRLTDRELGAEASLALPPEWRAGIAPRFAVSGAAKGSPAFDLTRALGSAHPSPQNATSVARTAGALRGPSPARLPDRSMDGDGQRDQGSRSVSLSICENGVTTESRLLCTTLSTGLKCENIKEESPVGWSEKDRNDCVTTAGVTTALRLPQSLLSRYIPRAGSIFETGEKQFEGSRNNSEAIARSEVRSGGGLLQTHTGSVATRSGSGETQEGKHGGPPEQWAGEAEHGSGIRPKSRRIPKLSRAFFPDKRQWEQYLRLYRDSQLEHARGAGEREGAGESARREGRRPGGMAPPTSAGAIAALSGWPRPK